MTALDAFSFIIFLAILTHIWYDYTNIRRGTAPNMKIYNTCKDCVFFKNDLYGIIINIGEKIWKKR